MRDIQLHYSPAAKQPERANWVLRGSIKCDERFFVATSGVAAAVYTGRLADRYDIALR